VRQVDASVGRLLDTLEAAGIADETAIVVAGDHGEEFQEHGHLAHYPKLYDELIHVPLIVNVPGEDGGRRASEHVGLDAIPPTVADLLDVESPPGWRGESLEPAVSGGESPDQESPSSRSPFGGEEVTEQPIPRSLSDGDLLVSVRDAEWTYIENADTAADGAVPPTLGPDSAGGSVGGPVRRGARGRRAVRADRRGPRRRTSRQTDGRRRPPTTARTRRSTSTSRPASKRSAIGDDPVGPPQPR